MGGGGYIIKYMPNLGNRPDNSLNGWTETRFYNTWSNMKQRCNNSNNNLYPNYGARGIKVCEGWKVYETFEDDMYDEYAYHIEVYGEDNTQLDRIDNNGNYCKENCRWVTRKENCQNRRNENIANSKKKFMVDGTLYGLKELSAIYKININTLKFDIYKKHISLLDSLNKRGQKIH